MDQCCNTSIVSMVLRQETRPRRYILQLFLSNCAVGRHLKPGSVNAVKNARFAQAVLTRRMRSEVDRKQTLCFAEYLMALSVTAHGDWEERLRWAFDVSCDDDRCLLTDDQCERIIEVTSQSSIRGDTTWPISGHTAVVFLLLPITKNYRLFHREY